MAKPDLSSHLAGIKFSHPLALAAGCDKSGERVQELLSAGFSGMEVGTVTPERQAGNPQPRVFRLREDRAVINRLGFSNDGAAVIARRLAELQNKNQLKGKLGINIGPGKAQIDNPAPSLRGLAESFAPLGDYLTVNLSSPNTAGLRDLQEKSQAQEILNAVREGAGAHKAPVFLKVSSDITDRTLEGAIQLAADGLCDGLIIGNTTTTRPEDLRSRHRGQVGGLSGRPLFAPSTERLARAWEMSEGTIPLIGVGGVDSAEAAWRKIIYGGFASTTVHRIHLSRKRLGEKYCRGLRREVAGEWL